MKKKAKKKSKNNKRIRNWMQESQKKAYQQIKELMINHPKKKMKMSQLRKRAEKLKLYC